MGRPPPLEPPQLLVRHLLAVLAGLYVVLIQERWILAALRHRTFFSLAELNGAIRELLVGLNCRAFKKLPSSRQALTPRIVNVEAPGDAVASAVPSRYQAQMNTVGYDVSDGTVVVSDRATGHAVVVHTAR